MTPDQLMRRAITLSREAIARNRGGPFGAVIARDGEIVSEGFNKVTSALDPTAHAEIVAIRRACRAVGRFDLRGAELFTSCEPCPMCLGAAAWARLDRIWFANGRDDAASIGFDDALLYRELALPMEARALPMQRLLAPEARAVFDLWTQKPDRVTY